MVFELSDDAQRWTAAERELALQVLHGQTVVVNVRRGGPHRHLVPWLRDHDMISYVGHPGSRHSWPRSDFANPFVKQAGADRETTVRRYRAWLDDQPELLARISAGRSDQRWRADGAGAGLLVCAATLSCRRPRRASGLVTAPAMCHK
jgi:hypothetical protein